jgi:hypothetical protein
MIAAGLLIAVLFGGGATADPADAAANRCGSYTDPAFGWIGIYVTKGHVSCLKAKSLIRRAVRGGGGGVPTGAGNSERYPDGWICGGQMGAITCSKPSTRHPKQSVTGRDCSQVGCPRRLGS